MKLLSIDLFRGRFIVILMFIPKRQCIFSLTYVWVSDDYQRLVPLECVNYIYYVAHVEVTNIFIHLLDYIHN